MIGVLQFELLLVLLAEAGEHAVKDVVVALAGVLRHDARLLQQILFDVGALDGAVLVEADVDVLAEARRVVVAHRLGVAECCVKKTNNNFSKETKQFQTSLPSIINDSTLTMYKRWKRLPF